MGSVDVGSIDVGILGVSTLAALSPATFLRVHRLKPLSLGEARFRVQKGARSWLWDQCTSEDVYVGSDMTGKGGSSSRVVVRVLSSLEQAVQFPVVLRAGLI